MAFGVEEYNNDSQWNKIKGAFAQTFTPTYNKAPEISFVEGVSSEKLRSQAQAGSTPAASNGSPWIVRNNKQ